jgi:hypothetical protein
MIHLSCGPDRRQCLPGRGGEGREKTVSAMELLQDVLQQAQRPAATLGLSEYSTLPVAAAVPGCRVMLRGLFAPAP